MKNAISVMVIMILLVLGCGYELTKKEDSKPSPGPPEISRENPDEPADSDEKTDDPEKQKLEERIAELEKQAKDPARKTPPPAKKQARTELEAGYMRVNSPGDGWLALRSQPNSGSRLLAKIPHGTVIPVDYCGDRVVSGRLRGRWCQVEYRGTTGWSFDYYLTR